MRQHKKKGPRTAEVGDKRKIYSQVKEEAQKKPRLVDDRVVFEFTAPQEEIFERIKDHGLLKVSVPLKTSKHLRNKRFYCAYHKDHNHTATRCKFLYD